MDVRSKIVDQVLESLPELSADLREKIERTLLTSLAVPKLLSMIIRAWDLFVSLSPPRN